jgi:predicted AAA+ superfamily ATPase
MYSNRYITEFIATDLKEKMVFLGGPRQVGKTELSLRYLEPPTRQSSGYLNWDIPGNRDQIRAGQIPGNCAVVVLDEIHKYARWRNLVKGLFDGHFPNTTFLVTGSARLDYYNKGGDSLQGRYHYYRLHPFTLPEIGLAAAEAHQLLELGGFPEPLLKGSSRTWRRWQRERMTRIINEDLRDLERVKELSLIEVLISALPSRVGSPLSINSLREDLAVNHETVQRWLTILDNLYVTHRVLPYGNERIRAVKKEQKLYFWDWSEVRNNPGARFENMVAMHLLKYCHFVEDTEGYKMELRYIRDTDGREVDFVVLKDSMPLFAVECKLSEKNPSPHLKYFRERTNIPLFFQVHLGDSDFGDATKGVRVLPFPTFCKEVELV